MIRKAARNIVCFKRATPLALKFCRDYEKELDFELNDDLGVE